MNTNSSPRKIALLSAGLTSIVPAILTGILSFVWWHIAIVISLTFLFSFLITLYLLERFIYRKIKIIYKSIHTSKTEKLQDTLEFDPISQVSDQVSAWAKERKDEINLLKEQEAFRREFVGNVSHELKTPIFQMQGYIDTLIEGALSDPKVNYTFLNKASNSVDRLIELVEDLTDLNKIESGDLKMEKSVFDLRTLVEEVFDDVEFLAKEHNARFGFKQSADVDFKVNADRKRIKQVLTNLIVNALKYGENGGKVLCGFYDMDKNVLIEISDKGEGIPKHALPRLFERFYRVEQSRNRIEGGSGLGLSIAKHIVEAHGQSINVRSELGKGSTFGFTLQKAI